VAGGGYAVLIGSKTLTGLASYRVFFVPRILVVDDEPLISMLLEDWLTELGCEVVGPASSLAEALSLAGSACLDGAIIDVRLGNEDCYPVAHALRARDVPFALATGAGDLGQEAGFDDPLLLAKPFDFEEVKAVIRKLLTQRPAA
jgi:DNA-binding response OmpR family regulator